MSYRQHGAALQRHLTLVPFLDDMAALAPQRIDHELWDAILDEAARLAENVLHPLGEALDRDGAKLVDGRVVTSDTHREAWRQFAAAGWIGLSLPEQAGGQAMPLLLVTACEELFNRASAAFMMLPTPIRCAAMLLSDAGDAALRDRWVDRLATGEWGATICISEPGAGSDIARIRTRAVQDETGAWRITGEKCWISFGDHDLTNRIGHCLLARTGTKPGVAGLSLFLVPDRDDRGQRDVSVSRIEDKLGLHGSPTCVLRFEGAEGTLLGAEGRGLQTLFRMLLLMRLSCSSQGIGHAAGACDTAIQYAGERMQGGANDMPVSIMQHVDVQRQLLAMAARVELGRGAALTAAIVMDLADLAPDHVSRERWTTLAQFLLPLVKDGSAWTAFEVASGALQVLGGAGYTTEWPVERMLRDARVFPVFEGTTGIQALDLLHRRLWRDEGAGLSMFVKHARRDAEALGGAEGDALAAALARLVETADQLSALSDSPRDAEAGATAFLDLCVLIFNGWIAARLLRLAGDDTLGTRMKGVARFALAEIDARSAQAARLSLVGEAHLAGAIGLADA